MIKFHTKRLADQAINQGSSRSLIWRLRFSLVVFVVLLAIPMTVLVKQGYQQFQKDICFQHTWAAEHVVIKLNDIISHRLKIEQERPFDDYQFF